MASETNRLRNMNIGLGGAGKALKDGIVGTLRGINEIESEVVSLIGNTLSGAIRLTGAVATAGVAVTRDVVKGTLQATEEVAKAAIGGVLEGTCEIGKAVKGVLVGVVGEVKEVAGPAIPRRSTVRKTESAPAEGGGTKAVTAGRKRRKAA